MLTPRSADALLETLELTRPDLKVLQAEIARRLVALEAVTGPMTHAHHWLVATDSSTDQLPASCFCGAARTFPKSMSYATGFGGTMTDNRERQRRLRRQDEVAAFEAKMIAFTPNHMNGAAE